MKFDLIQCTVRINHDGDTSKTEVVLAGPDAVTPAELVIIQMQHGTDDSGGGHAIRNAVKVGEVEMSRDALFDTIARRYRADAKAIFPSMSLVPRTLDDIELPHECLGRKPDTAQAQVDLGTTPNEGSTAGRKKAMRDALSAAGVDVPKGNLSEDDLLALMGEAGLTEMA